MRLVASAVRAHHRHTEQEGEFTHGERASFLSTKLNSHDDNSVLDGLKKDGYELSFRETPTPYFLNHEKDDGVTDLTFSIGLAVDTKGNVHSLTWHGPAFNAGMSLGDRILAVGDQPFSSDNLKAAVADSMRQPIQLRIEADGKQTTIQVSYQGALRYPYLQQVRGTQDGLAKLLKAR